MNKLVNYFKLLCLFLLLCSLVFWTVNTAKQSQFALKIKGQSYVFTAAEFNQAFDQAMNTAEQRSDQLGNVLTQQLHQAIDEKIQQAQANTQHYVNWHYSLLGSVLRMGENYAQQKMMEILFEQQDLTSAFQPINDQLAAYLQASINLQQNSFIDEFIERIKPYKKELTVEQLASLEELDLAEAYTRYISQHLDSQKATQQWLGSAAAGGLVSAAVVSRKLASQTAARASTQTGARAAGRLASLNACAPAIAAGPAAIICGGVVFVITTVVTESAILQYDKMANGAELKARLDHDLEALAASLKQQQQNMLQQLLAADKAQLSQTITEYIKPIELLAR